jgi:GR25 family glycosyltransferase involved in LPS biosynthesis
MDIYVINLNKRIDRWEKISKIFNKFNLIRVEAIEDNIDGAVGCFKSHQKCIEQAKKLNLNKILVFEDDCDLLNIEIENFYNLILKLNDFLNSFKDWKMFYGCGNKLMYKNLKKKICTINLNEICNEYTIYECDFLKTTHFVWYNNVIYDWVLNLDPYIDKPIDKIWHGKFDCLIIIPFITTQSDDYSNITKNKCSYNSSIKRYERRIIKRINSNKIDINY